MNSKNLHSHLTLPKKAVLLVEDSECLRKLMSNMLGKTYEVTAARNGLEAMTWLHSGLLPDVIVTDVQMPELDGRQLLSGLRNSGMYQNIPVIVVSGSCEKAEIDHIRSLGANDILPKPFSPTELTGSLNRLMEPRLAAA